MTNNILPSCKQRKKLKILVLYEVLKMFSMTNGGTVVECYPRKSNHKENHTLISKSRKKYGEA